MELKIVYRILRKISDWSVGGFYSEVYVEGHENMTRDKPLIMYVPHYIVVRKPSPMSFGHFSNFVRLSFVFYR